MAQNSLAHWFRLSPKSLAKYVYKKKMLKQQMLVGEVNKGAAMAARVKVMLTMMNVGTSASNESGYEESPDVEHQRQLKEQADDWRKTEAQFGDALAGSSQSQDSFKDDVFESGSSESTLASTEGVSEVIPSEPAVQFSNPLVVFVKGMQSQTEPGLIAIGGLIGSAHPANLGQTVSVF